MSEDDDRYGFRWGPAVVCRMAEFQRPNGLCRVIAVTTDAGQSVDIYISPTGRSVRVYRDGREMT